MEKTLLSFIVWCPWSWNSTSRHPLQSSPSVLLISLPGETHFKLLDSAITVCSLSLWPLLPIAWKVTTFFSWSPFLPSPATVSPKHCSYLVSSTVWPTHVPLPNSFQNSSLPPRLKSTSAFCHQAHLPFPSEQLLFCRSYTLEFWIEIERWISFFLSFLSPIQKSVSQ